AMWLPENEKVRVCLSQFLNRLKEVWPPVVTILKVSQAHLSLPHARWLLSLLRTSIWWTCLQVSTRFLSFFFTTQHLRSPWLHLQARLGVWTVFQVQCLTRFLSTFTWPWALALWSLEW